MTSRTATHVSHKRTMLVLNALVLVALLAETLLRINGLIPEIVGQVIFGGAVTLGVGGTFLLAVLAPVGTESAEATSVEDDAQDDETAGDASDDDAPDAQVIPLPTRSFSRDVPVAA